MQNDTCDNGPIFLQTIPIPVQAQNIWAWNGIIFDWMILLRIFVFRDHLNGNFWNSQQPIIVYDVSWLNFDDVRLCHVCTLCAFLYLKKFEEKEPEPGSGSFVEILGHCSYLRRSYLKIGSHGNALPVSFFRRRVHLRSRTHEFHYSPEKRCGKLGPYVSFNEIHVIVKRMF